MRYRTLTSLANDLCVLHLGDAAGNKMGVALRALRATMDELNMSVAPNIVSQLFEIGSDYTIQMPASCMQITKVGVLCDNGGKVRFMGRVDDIRRGIEPVCCLCEDATATSSAVTCNACAVYGVPFSISSKGELYGYRPPEFPNGTFRYNRAENRIEFGSGYDVFDGSSVLVEYLSSLGGNEYDMIPSELGNAFMFHAAHTINMSARPGVANNYMNEFKRSFNTYKSIQVNYDADDLVAALRGQSMSAPKF